ncbi:MAG: hypothetical protein ACLR6J_11525 [Parabacteroides merdae]
MQTVQQYERTSARVAENSCFLLGNSTNNFFKDNRYLGKIGHTPEDEGATYENTNI